MPPIFLQEAREGSDPGQSYLALMRRNTLTTLAVGRRTRLQGGGRPDFCLTDEEIKRSTGTAMRLAGASMPGVKARDDAGSVERTVQMVVRRAPRA